MKRRPWKNRLRPSLAAGVGLLITVIVVTLGWRVKCAEHRQARTEAARLEGEMLDMRIRLERVEADRAELAPEDRGHGPGGARSRDEEWFFAGPTAASAALDLMTAADRSGFRRLSYAGGESSVEARFPTSEDLPVRHPVYLVRWPVHFEMEATYDQSLELMESLAMAAPAFSLSRLRLDVALDSRGDVVDRLVLTGELAGHWFDGKRRPDVE